MRVLRREFLARTAGVVGGGALLARAPGLWAADAPPGFDFEQLKARAADLAQTPFNGETVALPQKLADLDPASYQQIRFRHDNALWRDDDSRFRVVFRHLGSFYRRPVEINVIEPAGVQPVAYSPDLFDYGVDGFVAELPPDLGYAGFTLHYSDEDPAHFPEVATFHGASYFRILGKGQQYGLSARGLAVDTALPRGEEFPFFREFWLEKPQPGDDAIRILALLDSPSITGAYDFRFRCGVVAVAEVSCTLFPRHQIAKLGIAPLTSMFMFGENRGRVFDDYRPELHDSDGLLVQNGRGEWLWRPLANHSTLQVSAFVDENPRGFGLFQRDLQFSHYQDLDARYERRPSIWVEPRNDWGRGHVELIEIPSDHSDNDNVVAFWVNEQPVAGGQPLDYAYRLHTQLDEPRRPPIGRVEATRIGHSESRGGGRRFMLDFAGGTLADFGPDARLEPFVKTHQGELGPVELRYNPQTQGWRLSFDLFPNDQPLCEMRAFLRTEQQQVTETWTYRWTPA